MKEQMKEKEPQIRLEIEELEERIAPAALAPFVSVNDNPGQGGAHAAGAGPDGVDPDAPAGGTIGAGIGPASSANLGAAAGRC